jgi:hypothetical protein
MGCNLFSMVIYKMAETDDPFSELGDLPTDPARGPGVTMNMGMDPPEFSMGPGEMGPGEMGPGEMGPGEMGPGEMGPGEMGGSEIIRSPSKTDLFSKQALEELTKSNKIAQGLEGIIENSDPDYPDQGSMYQDPGGMYPGQQEVVMRHNVDPSIQDMQMGQMYRGGYKRRRSSKRRSSKRRSSKRRSSKRRSSKRRPSKRRPSKRRPSKRRPSKRRPSKKKKSTRRRKPTRK